MSTKGQSRQRTPSGIQRSEENLVAGPDPSWRGLYRAGGVAVFLYIVFGIIVPAVIFLSSNYDTGMDGDGILRFIASNRLWWTIVQTLTLGPSILAIVVFTALFMALKHLNKSYAAIGAVVAITCQVLFIAYYPVVMGLVYLSDQYTALPPSIHNAPSLQPQLKVFLPRITHLIHSTKPCLLSAF